MSKKYVLFILCISCFLLTGCGEVTDLTDEETTLIAEYAAEILLKYDVNFDDRLNEGEKVRQEMEIEAENDALTEEAAMPSTENVEQENTSGDYTDEVTDDENDDTSSQDSHNRDSRITDDSSDEPVDSDSLDNVGTESDIAKILGMDGISITYKDYVITDHYPATDTDGQFIYLESTEGYQLLVLKFDVSNTTDDTMNLTMLDESIDYRIVCNKKHAANPMLTILMNDLGTIETTLSPAEKQEGVLVFQISDDMKSKLESIELKVDHNNTENIITIM